MLVPWTLLTRPFFPPQSIPNTDVGLLATANQVVGRWWGECTVIFTLEIPFYASSIAELVSNKRVEKISTWRIFGGEKNFTRFEIAAVAENKLQEKRSSFRMSFFFFWAIFLWSKFIHLGRVHFGEASSGSEIPNCEVLCTRWRRVLQSLNRNERIY